MKQTVNSYFREHKAQVLLWLVLTAIVSVLAPLKTFQLKWLIDSSSKNEAFYYIAVVFAVTLGSHTFEFLCRKIYTQIATNAIQDVRTSIMEKVLNRSYVEYSSESDASYISLLSTDVRILYDDYYMGLFEVVFWGEMMVVSLCLFFYLSPLLLLLAVLISIPPLVIPRIINAKLTKIRNEYSWEMEKYIGHIKEILGGYEVVRNFLCEPIIKKKHTACSKQNAQKEYNYQQSINSVLISSSLISNVTLSVMLLVGILMVYDGKITLGTMTSATNLISFVIAPCQRVTQAYAKIKGNKGVRDKFSAVLCVEEKERASGVIVKEVRKVVCENVEFTYPGSSQIILNDIHMSLEKKEKVAVIGESGCGKSTFAKLLYGYYPEYKGSIFFDQCELHKIERQSLYERVGYLSQNTFLFNDSIRNNICLFETFSDQRIMESINLSGLRKFIDSLPEGIDTVLEENGKNISGGQRQRIGIARMIIRRYDMVVADEITANLDMETTEEVMNNLLALPCSMIVITHNISGEYMKRFDRIYQMKNGTMEVLPD